MTQILLSSNDTSYVVLVVLGFIVIMFVLPSLMSAAFDKAEKKADQGNGSCLGAIFIGVIILFIIGSILQIKDCSRHNNYHNDREPRHTHIIEKPMQSFVNNFIFNT